MLRFIVLFCGILGVFSAPQKLRLQPELDVVDVDKYLTNDRLFNIQVKCVIYDGPCDAVGRWLKPRVASGLLGECLFCTPKQVKDVKKLLTHMQENKPDIYRKAIVKYLENAGIDVPENSSEKKGNPEKEAPPKVSSKETPNEEEIPEENTDSE